MFRFGKFGFPSGDDICDEIKRSETLAKDLAELSAGLAPAQDRLAAAPFLADFYFLLHPTIVCMGNVTGYPGTPGTTLMHTSEVVVDGSSQGWLRTRSRYYRVGRQLPSPVRSASGSGREVSDNHS